MPVFCSESPPLARGTVSLSGADAATRRITPACAGNRAYSATITAAEGDHPRLRGEQRTWRQRTSYTKGSPPLARGTAVKYGHTRKEIRITPRLRGEQQEGETYTIPKGGSPPLARGTGHTVLLLRRQKGITPACAGNSELGGREHLIQRDHPRLRGEQ